MARVVVDPNVLIAALISPRGAPAALYRALAAGRFELVVSPQLLAELERVLMREKFRRYASLDQAHGYVRAVARLAVLADDPAPTPGATPDPGDDYLVALARAEGVDAIVSGDRHLLGLEQPEPPVLSARAFLDQLDEGEHPRAGGRASPA
ncbi:putative toxin-antitoxin system toxin component, PIN family [Conexibacter arvalis]|uniref:Putative PIN family toxin of toxin-antitoxin system n=1 Tax=Conexibacter arvalis TaxID=912552 RepID=A0A840IJ05_9ACTN|nr:putative PIN family toxin of toxin-antitoxin system [Conexibacter arvalis]